MLNTETLKAGFLLSGEHETLPFGELKALFEIFNINSENLKLIKNYAIFESELNVEAIQNIVKRGGYVNEGVITSYSIHYTKLYDLRKPRMSFKMRWSRMRRPTWSNRMR